jgi:hypothetical protein
MRQDKITIHGPKNDGAYMVEFKTADGVALAISVPRGSGTTVLEYFQDKMPYGLAVPDVPTAYFKRLLLAKSPLVRATARLTEPPYTYSASSRAALHDATDAIAEHVVIFIIPFAGWARSRSGCEDQRGHGRSHRRALGRSSACRPASVIRTRVTSISRSPAVTRSVVTLACPALISSTNTSLLKPCAIRIAAVQPSGDAASNSSARRRLALRRGSSAILAMHWM